VLTRNHRSHVSHPTTTAAHKPTPHLFFLPIPNRLPWDIDFRHDGCCNTATAKRKKKRARQKGTMWVLEAKVEAKGVPNSRTVRLKRGALPFYWEKCLTRATWRQSGQSDCFSLSRWQGQSIRATGRLVSTRAEKKRYKNSSSRQVAACFWCCPAGPKGYHAKWEREKRALCVSSLVVVLATLLSIRNKKGGSLRRRRRSRKRGPKRCEASSCKREQ